MFPHQQADRKAWSRVADRGITLLEVLISMFVLMFGLLGVASLFPVGTYHTARALGYDQAAAVGQAAFQEIQVRGLLQPENWIDSSGVKIPASSFPPFQFDPEAVAPASGMKLVYQAGYRKGEAGPGVFFSRDDLAFQLPEDGSLPPVQLETSASRTYQGDYSWMFTVAPHPANREGVYVVSVVVFYKRNRDHEWSITDAATNWGFRGFKLVLHGHAVATKERIGRLERGSWILLSRPSENFYSWYQIEHYAENQGAVRDILTIAGRDQMLPTNRVDATFFDRVVAVYEKIISVEDFSSEFSFGLP